MNEADDRFQASAESSARLVSTGIAILSFDGSSCTCVPLFTQIAVNSYSTVEPSLGSPSTYEEKGETFRHGGAQTRQSYVETLQSAKALKMKKLREEFVGMFQTCSSPTTRT